MEATSTLKQANKKIIPLAISMASTNLINVAGGFLCMAMVAHLGNLVLAASALMISTQISIMVIAMSLLFSLSILVGHAYGAKNYLAIGNFMQLGWTFGAIVSLPIMVLFWFIEPVFIFLDQPISILPVVRSFFHAYIWAVPPILLGICNQQLCYGVHQQRLVVITSFLGVGVLLVTAYLLIFGKLGLPALGVTGLGYAMAAQAWFGLLMTMIFLMRQRIFNQFDLFTFRAHKHWDYLRQMLKISWPMSVQISAEMISFFVTSIMVGWLGAQALAAFQIVNQYVFLIVVPVFAIAQASSVAIGQAKGAGTLYEIKNLGYASLRLALIYSLLAALVFISLPKVLATFYLDVNNPANAVILNLVTWLFVIAAFSQAFDAVRNVMTGALRGLFDSKFPMYAGILVLWVIAFPLNYTLAFIAHWGVFGIASGFAISMLIGAVIIMYRWRQLTKLIVIG